MPKFYLLFYLCFVINLASCAQWIGFPSYFDPTTYKNLTDLKPRVLMLYDTFGGDELNQKDIDQIRLKLAQMYEYEKGKGERNRETIAQLQIIQQMFERHLEDRMTGGSWTKTHLNNQKENIGEAFDIAIRTESLKNKNE